MYEIKSAEQRVWTSLIITSDKRLPWKGCFIVVLDSVFILGTQNGQDNKKRDLGPVVRPKWIVQDKRRGNL